MHRRAFLAGVATAAVAGCLGGNGSGGGTTASDGSGGDPATDGNGSGGDAGSDLATNPGAAGLAGQPTLGPAPTDAGAVIVAFEDPSCPTCRRFEETTFPEIRSQWTDAGRASFVFRCYPIIYPWGKPAVQALEAVYARDAATFWTLKDYYYRTQSAFDASNVLDRTERFIAANTDLDAAAVVADARQKRYDDAVQADLDAGKASGFSATPSFLLFRDGAFVTSLTGAKSFSVFQNALQL